MYKKTDNIIYQSIRPIKKRKITLAEAWERPFNELDVDFIIWKAERRYEEAYRNGRVGQRGECVRQ